MNCKDIHSKHSSSDTIKIVYNQLDLNNEFYILSQSSCIDMGREVPDSDNEMLLHQSPNNFNKSAEGGERTITQLCTSSGNTSTLHNQNVCHIVPNGHCDGQFSNYWSQPYTQKELQ